jgi:hypothetical protein
MADDFEACLPQSAKDRGIASGVEYALLFQDAVTAISCADERQIAVLGVESFTAQSDGLFVMDYSGYELSFDGEDWPSYVKANNVQAMQFLEKTG